jgi:hypothetical protein
MTPKEKVLAFVHRFDDRVTTDEVLYKLDLFIGVETGLQQVERGQVIDHDELFDRLLSDEPTNAPDMVRARRPGSRESKDGNRPERAKNGSPIRKTTKKVRRST